MNKEQRLRKFKNELKALIRDVNYFVYKWGKLEKPGMKDLWIKLSLDLMNINDLLKDKQYVVFRCARCDYVLQTKKKLKNELCPKCRASYEWVVSDEKD